MVLHFRSDDTRATPPDAHAHKDLGVPVPQAAVHRGAVRPSIRVPAVLAGCVLLLAGCGTTTIHPRVIEREIARGYEHQVPGSAVRSVRCPHPIDSKVGTRVTCTLTLHDGTSGPVAVTVLDGDGHVRWKVLTR